MSSPILPWPTARKRIAARSCHCRTPGNAFRERFAIDERPKKAPRRNDATDRRPKTHHGEILPRPAPSGRMASICCHGRALRGYAAEICCRCLSGRYWRAAAMKEPGRSREHRPLRREWGICVAPVHWYTRRSVFGKWGHCAACTVPCASWRPHRRGMGSPGSILGGDNRADFHGRGVGVPFQRLNCEERL